MPTLSKIGGFIGKTGYVPDGCIVELYDLKKDPNESKNIADENPVIVSKLTKKLIDWYRINDKQMLKMK